MFAHNLYTDLFHTFSIFYWVEVPKFIQPGPFHWTHGLFTFFCSFRWCYHKYFCALNFLFCWIISCDRIPSGIIGSGRNISLTLAIHNLKICFESYFSCYREKVKTQLLMVRITWGNTTIFQDHCCSILSSSCQSFLFISFNFHFSLI